MSEQAAFCYNCGTKIEGGESFCRACGRRSGQLEESSIPEAALRIMRPDTMPPRNQDTNDYGQDSSLSGPPSYSTGADSAIDPIPTLYSPSPASYSQNLGSSYGQASGSYSQGSDSHRGGQNSYPPRFDSYPTSSGQYASQPISERSNKRIVGVIFALFLATVIGIFLGLWVSDAI